ncbi:MAG: HAMP domain-containing histidine kinase, partial [Sporichthyaceae bacterium]|nr:HAMP domain-containing histidine kinase [Sporichthyaceae bacterium]
FMIGTTLRSGDDGVYELYYLFPLDQEEATLALVQRTLFTASALLLVLIGVIAWFVVRQTVTPVRLAARIAERLAAGGLQERMHVRGEDDLARLATSFNKMATNLERQIKQLEDLSRMQQRFVSDVSHELRTPLTTVRMAADVLHEARPQLNPAAARSAELLQKELDRFESLLGELLEISRFDAGVAVLEPEEVDCRELARQATTSLGALAERAGIELVLDLPAGPCPAEVDPRRIDRILRNLVANAIEHGERRPVQVTVGADDRTVAFTVRDHGVGLRPGEAASVFNRFWRADPARTRTTGGTGLGLAIALEDTHLHGGWLQAWGRPGLGSQFRLTLPRELGGAVESSPLPMVPTPVVGSAARHPAGPAVGAGGHPVSSTTDELAGGRRA